MSRQEKFNLIDLRKAENLWDQLITDEDELLENGYPLEIITDWIAQGEIVPISEHGGVRHFYTKHVFEATVRYYSTALGGEAENDSDGVIE